MYMKELPSGAPHRVTKDADNDELYPSWSSDGKSIVYASWNDDALGAIRTVGVDGEHGRKLTTTPGHYIEPRFSDNGQQIVFRRIGSDGLRSGLYTRDRGIYMAAAAGGEPKLITEEGSTPRFNKAGDRIYVSGNEAQKAALVSFNTTGGDRRVHLISE